ncbi:MAG: hypothetical protein M3Q76_07545 [Acidobacteriota bacterium]|nr:hypothetical protein [Acidobacteriota bacterium]
MNESINSFECFSDSSLIPPHSSLSLLHNPRVAVVEQFLQIAGAGFTDGGVDLIDEHVFVSGALDGTEDADGLRKEGER